MYLLVSDMKRSIFSIIMSIVKTINDVIITINKISISNLLQYRLHLSEITDTDTRNNADTDQS